MIQRLEQEKNVLNKEKKALQKGMNTLQKKLDNRPDVPILFRGHYEVGRDNVVDLSRLILKHLEKKPRILTAIEFSTAYVNAILLWKWVMMITLNIIILI